MLVFSKRRYNGIIFPKVYLRYIIWILIDYNSFNFEIVVLNKTGCVSCSHSRADENKTHNTMAVFLE